MARSRLVAILLTLLATASLVSACEDEFSGVHLRIAAGSPAGVYYALSQPLADAWASSLHIDRPQVLQTGGSPDNLRRLESGEADVAFIAADVAAQPSGTGRSPRALARIYDDYLHVVVRASAATTKVGDLRGQRVSIGAQDSGVAVIANRILEVAGLGPDAITIRNLNLDDSEKALADGTIDAFFWSGGLPTRSIAELNKRLPLRLLDIGDLMPGIRERYPVYNIASIPASTYNFAGGAATTLVVPNFLLVTDPMPDDLAEALVRELFAAQPALVRANPAALSIDIHSAIETEPVALHPGALRFYRDGKV